MPFSKKIGQKRDVISFESLFREYYQRLCTYACMFIRDPDEAEGIVKDVFLKIWENWQTIDIRTSQAGYLYTAVRNNCINFLGRELKKRQEILIKLPEDISFTVASNTYDISDELSARELEMRIKQLIDDLPQHCREIFIMSRFDDLSYEQISQILNITTGTVKTQIFRALNKIRAGISDYLTAIVVIGEISYSLA